MARMTPERDAVVVRLVYDGPPRSGKTTRLGALAAGLGRTLVSPEEAQGRTLYFDWLEHVGGRFEGVPIRFQILSVPGLDSLEARHHRPGQRKAWGPRTAARRTSSAVASPCCSKRAMRSARRRRCPAGST